MSVQEPLNMNPEIRDEWVRRLRSGEYEQGTEWLNKDGKFCCLGVLCEMAAEQGVVERSMGASEGEVVVAYGVDTHFPDQVLPDAVKLWAGLESDDPLTYIHSRISGYQSLARLNDSGWPFADIADVIEGVYAVS